tara:strand:+ start:120 stop:506 length:387 start_codon:yes stop_codon:yes gene_type:complete
MKTLGKILSDVQFLMDAVVNDYQPKEKKATGYTQDFLEFYKSYGVLKTKSQSFPKWKKLNEQEKATVMSLIPLYHKAFEPKFRKYPNNFLSNNSWEDYVYLLEAAKEGNAKAEKIAKAQKTRLDSYNF